MNIGQTITAKIMENTSNMIGFRVTTLKTIANEIAASANPTDRATQDAICNRHGLPISSMTEYEADWLSRQISSLLRR